MLAIASADEDDDAETARGGAHEMPQPRDHTKSLCPACGADAIIKSKAEWGGGWVCYKKRGGCGVKWPEGPFPVAASVAAPNTMTAEQLFETPGEETERKEQEAATLLNAIQKRWEHLKTPVIARVKQWERIVGSVPYASPDADPAVLADLLRELGA